MVYFVGAGAGDPELLTVKGKRLIESAQSIIYAGSLVNPELLKFAPSGCKIRNSAEMTLDEIIDVMQNDADEGRDTIRLHTGDPSLFGAVREQMDRLDGLNIEYESVPGVSSFLAAAASMNIEYTVPNVSQTVILTRMGGRTGVPARQDIESLARHRASMVIFLSVSMIDKLCEKLLTAYDRDTPAAVVYKASWEDEKIIRGNLESIAEKVKLEGIKKTALILVGDFMEEKYEQSKLYNKNFSHEFRKAKENEE